MVENEDSCAICGKFQPSEIQPHSLKVDGELETPVSEADKEEYRELRAIRALGEMTPEAEREYAEKTLVAIKHDEPIDQQIALLEAEKRDLWRQMIKADAEGVATMAHWYYHSGRFIPYVDSVFRKIWLGDEHILHAIAYMAASFRLVNPDEGIHLFISGLTQIGKSDSGKSSLKFIHPKDQLIRTFSPKWLFYAKEAGLLHENTIVFSDDTSFDKEVAALYRNILTSWHEGVTRGTVDDQKARDLNIPRHVSLILTSTDAVSQIDDKGQDNSRFLQMEVRRTPEQEQEIRLFIQQEKENVSSDIFRIHCIWSAIPERKVTIHKIIEKVCTIREFKRYLTLLKCNALLCNRDITNEDDIKVVDDFLSYSKPMIDSQTPAHKRDEAAVLSVLRPDMEMTISMIQQASQMSRGRVSRAFHDGGTFDNPKGGLLVTCKQIKYEYYTETREHKFILI